MSLFRRTPSRAVPSVRGVFDVDPSAPPVVPPTARAVEVRNAAGEVISYVWVLASYADETVYTNLWSYLDRHDPVTPPCSSLKLL